MATHSLELSTENNPSDVSESTVYGMNILEPVQEKDNIYSSHQYDNVSNKSHATRHSVDFSKFTKLDKEVLPVKDTKSSLQRKRTSRDKIESLNSMN